MEYEFTLKFRLPATTNDVGELIERLGATGCNDTLVGIGQSGCFALEFTRASESARHAIFSALEEVRCALPEANELHHLRAVRLACSPTPY